MALRVAFAVNGDPDAPATQSGVARHLGTALSARDDLGVVPLDLSLRSLDRWRAAATSVRRNRDRWRWAMHGSPSAIAARTRRLAAILAAVEPPVDVVLGLRTVYEPIATPYATYIDNTVELAARCWPPSAPWRGRGLRRALEGERAYFSGATHVFATGRLVADSLVSGYGVDPERVSVVGAGSHYGAAPPVPPEQRQPWVLFVGRDLHRKGGDRLLAAFREVVRRVPEARLKLVGEHLRIDEPGVEVLGPVRNRARLAELFARSRVYALPVRYEPYGISLLEAMGHGLPCVATGAGAVPEIIDDGRTGRIVPPDDPARLADVLVELLEDPVLAAAMGEAGRARVAQELNWDAVAARMADALRRAAGPQTSEA